jgi:hypothetical protein
MDPPEIFQIYECSFAAPCLGLYGGLPPSMFVLCAVCFRDLSPMSSTARHQQAVLQAMLSLICSLR